MANRLRLLADDNLPQAVPVNGNHPFFRRRRMREQNLEVEPESVSSPFLLDLISEDLPCVSVLSGAQVEGCNRIVERCRTFPAEIYYQCPRTGRTPLHVAALRCACLHVVEAITSSVGETHAPALDIDAAGNTPLHLFFVGLSTRRVDPERSNEILNQLLGPRPASVVSMSNREGCLALHFACSAPESMTHPSMIERLLEANPRSATVANNKGQTALHLHCKRPNASTQVASMLLDAHSTRPNLDRENGWNPLHYAASNSNTDLIRLLINKYVDEEFSFAKIRSSNEHQTALHILCLQNPCEHHLDAVQALLLAAPDTVTMGDSVAGQTPLHLLCRGSRVHEQIVRALVQAVPATLMIADNKGYLPLHYACEGGADPEIIMLLLNACPESVKALTRKKDTALSLACSANKSLESIEMLLQANPDATAQANDYGFVPLHSSVRAYQPRLSIVQALLKVNVSSARLPTNAGEYAVHLASNNTSASTAVLDALSSAVESDDHLDDDDDRAFSLRLSQEATLANKIGNTPLHYACFRGAPADHIESLAVSNSKWLTTRNNAGYSPLQIICKSGRVDEHIIGLFARMGGPDVFSVVDLMGNTPLHSAMREETDVKALLALIRAFPGALHMKTMYDDTPLHLACLRRVDSDVVREVALASSAEIKSALLVGNGARLSPILVQNTAGQTPIGIAMEEFERVCCQDDPRTCCVKANYTREQTRAFDVLATLVKILHYGPVEVQENDGSQQQSLVGACVALHRMDVRLDPAFIRRALHLRPEDARVCDAFGNYPLHIEASIPIEKMSLLDAPRLGCCGGGCHRRMGLLRMLLEIYPEAAQQTNDAEEFPLGLMIQNGRPWDSAFALSLRNFPQALHSVRTIEPTLLPQILHKLSNKCGNDAVFTFLRSRPNR